MRWWLSQRRRYLEFMILLTIVRVWFRRQSWMSPSDNSLHLDVPPPPPCPQAAGDPGDRFTPPDVDGMRRHRVSGDESTSGVDGVDEDDDEDTVPFNGVCSSLSWRRISSVATPPLPPLSLEPSAEILPASSSTPSFGTSTVDSFSTSILNDQQTLRQQRNVESFISRTTTTSVCELKVIGLHYSQSSTLRIIAENLEMLKTHD